MASFTFSFNKEGSEKASKKGVLGRVVNGGAKASRALANVKKPKRLGLVVALALLVPMLVVGGAWAFGFVRFPVLEDSLGVSPPWMGEREGSVVVGSTGASSVPVFVRVDDPQDQDRVTGTVVFGGQATSGSTVVWWVKGYNVPLEVAAPSGVWSYTWNSGGLAPREYVLVFAAKKGNEWSSQVERTVVIQKADSDFGGLKVIVDDWPDMPLQQLPILRPASDGWASVVSKVPPMAQPMLQFFTPVARALDPVVVRVGETKANLQNDVDQNGVMDWAESSPVQPTSLSPLIPTTRWVNLILIGAFLGLPVAIVGWRNPELFREALKKVGELRAKRLAAKREDLAARRKLGLERDRLDKRVELEQTRGQFKVKGLKVREAERARVMRERIRAKVEERRLRVSEASSQAQAKVVSKRLDAQVQALRVQEANLKRLSAPSTVINIGRSSKKGGKKRRGG